MRAAFAVKGDPDVVKLFSLGAAGLAVRRPGMFSGQQQSQSDSDQSTELQIDPVQLSIDLNAAFTGLTDTTSNTSQAAGSAAQRAAEGLSTSGQSESDEPTQPPASQFVAPQGASASDRRLKPVFEQFLQPGRARHLAVTRQQKEKQPSDPLA